MNKTMIILSSLFLAIFFVACASKTMEETKVEDTKAQEEALKAEKETALKEAKVEAKKAKETKIEAPKATSPESATLTIEDAVIASSVKNLTPEGIATEFSKDASKIFCFSKVVGAEGETSIKHIWYHNDSKTAEIELPVKSQSWRTYSYKTFVPELAGSWKVDITDDSGNILKSLNFDIK